MKPPGHFRAQRVATAPSYPDPRNRHGNRFRVFRVKVEVFRAWGLGFGFQHAISALQALQKSPELQQALSARVAAFLKFSALNPKPLNP